MTFWIIEEEPEKKKTMYVDRAPPVRIVAVITLFCSTLDLLADLLMCNKLRQLLPLFITTTGYNCAIGYFVFTGVSIIVYIVEMADVFLTLKRQEESRFLSRLSKSLVIALEEVPLPMLLYLIITHEEIAKLASPAMIASCIKLIALVWGIIKFTKLRFCWFFYPCAGSHETSENVRRCFTFTWWRLAMLIVNICHILAIIIVILNITISSQDVQAQNEAIRIKNG